jgi:uncharacterized alkaline shock family protein YloU
MKDQLANSFVAPEGKTLSSVSKSVTDSNFRKFNVVQPIILRAGEQYGITIDFKHIVDSGGNIVADLKPELPS